MGLGGPGRLYPTAILWTTMVRTFGKPTWGEDGAPDDPAVAPLPPPFDPRRMTAPDDALIQAATGAIAKRSPRSSSRHQAVVYGFLRARLLNAHDAEEPDQEAFLRCFTGWGPLRRHGQRAALATRHRAELAARIRSQTETPQRKPLGRKLAWNWTPPRRSRRRSLRRLRRPPRRMHGRSLAKVPARPSKCATRATSASRQSATS